MALKKLPKNKSDIRFLNVETMEVECTYNQCFSKFIEANAPTIKTPEWNDYKPIKHINYFHQCNECNRTQKNNDDKRKSISDYESRIASGKSLELTEDEIRTTSRGLQDVLSKVKDPYKKSRIESVLSTLDTNII